MSYSVVVVVSPCADCAAVFAGGHKRSGVYYVKPTTAGCPVPVWCDMDTPPGGWLVFQRRQDGTVGFNRNWAQYRHGFGNVAGEHWLGNDNLFLLSNQVTLPQGREGPREGGWWWWSGGGITVDLSCLRLWFVDTVL